MTKGETYMPPWLVPSLLPAYAAALLFGYLCGSIPFGLILTRLAGTADIRAIGSGNIGATNVLRTGRKGLAAATLACDMLKGTVAVLVTYRVARLPAHNRGPRQPPEAPAPPSTLESSG